MIPRKENPYSRIDLSLCFLISIGALGFSLFSGFTAYQYNEIDMLPFWERMSNPKFIPNDFFTNASVEPNSRHVWGQLVLTLSNISRADWYSVLYLVKLLFVATIGPLYYLALVMFYHCYVRQHLAAFRLIAASFAFLCVSNIYFVQFFTIAWWPPLIQDANAHNMAILFGLCSLLFHGRSVAIPLASCSSLLHPVFGFVFFGLHALLLFRERRFIFLVVQLLCALALPFALHTLWFKSATALTAKEFVDLYAVYRHPGHYIPSQFGRMGLSSLQVYLLLSILLGGAIWYTYSTAQKILFYASIYLLVFMNGCIGLQYFLVEKYPVKIVAIVGPSRYLLFMGWGIAFIYGSILAEFSIRFQQKLSKFTSKLQSSPGVLITGVISVALTSALILRMDSPKTEKDTPVLTWIRTQTPAGSTFATNNWILDEMDIRYIGQRAVYAGECFPFKEDFFKEYYERAIALYGKPEDWIGEKNIVLQKLYYYRKNRPENFLEAAQKFPLDYVIIDARESRDFSSYRPAYKNSTLHIYSISELKGIKLPHEPFVTSVIRKP